ncbi:hypothetical protein SEUCBS139899_000987 [Sporothrix eucalyptigena]|uniref:Zn(2)-C6 fungal-type domain-containing protein n=1 Tax=Sporothrix eucalyptigena TaxID=1812306 RepID=A0ABP0C9V1_9PEZI
MEPGLRREPGGRTPQACDACRKSKTKCSGTRPKCRRCIKRKTPCTWPPSYNVPGTPESLPEVSPTEQHVQTAHFSSQTAVSPDGTSSVISTGRPALPPRLLDIFYERHHDVEFCGFLHKPTTTMAGLEAKAPFLATAIASLGALYLENDDLARQCAALGLPTCPIGLSAFYGQQAISLGRQLFDEPSIYTIQAFLVLAMRELIAWRDFKAWTYTGTALRISHALQLGVELDADQQMAQRNNVGPRQRETRRRTFWACFVVDRIIAYACHHRFYISLPPPSAAGSAVYGSRGGSEDVRLPSKDSAFAYDENEPGPWLNDFVSAASEDSAQRHALSRISITPFYTVMVGLWGDMAVLHATGGRRCLQHTPADPDGAFFKANSALVDFATRVVPPALHWSAANYRLHGTTGPGQAQAFVQFNFLLHHARCIMHHEYLPQLDMQYFPPGSLGAFGELGVDQVLASDAAGLPPDYADKSLIDPCIDAVNVITEMATALYDNQANPQDMARSRAILQSTVVAHAIMTAAGVHLWVVYTQSCDKCPKPVARAKFLLLLRIIQSWEPRWPVAAAWGETLGLLYKLYEYSYGTEPVPEFASWEAGEDAAISPSMPGHGSDESTPNWKAGESSACRDHQGLSYGDMLPDPATVGQSLHDKVRSILGHPLHAPDVKRKNLRAFSQSLWQQQAWMLPELMGGTNNGFSDINSSLLM